MLDLLLATLRRHGAPDALYLDNGSTYCGVALRLCCERLGITLIHARPYDAPARGKMERFWRTLRAGCLDHLGGLTSLHDVQVRLGAFLDEHYHRAPHGGLLGKAPAEAWASASCRAVDEPALAAALTIHCRRRVRKDGTVDLDGRVWQLDQGFLAGRVVTVVTVVTVVAAHAGLAGDPVALHDGHRYAMRPADPVAASRTRRRRRGEAPTPTIPFDPAGALRAAHGRSSRCASRPGAGWRPRTQLAGPSRPQSPHVPVGDDSRVRVRVRVRVADVGLARGYADLVGAGAATATAEARSRSPMISP